MLFSFLPGKLGPFCTLNLNATSSKQTLNGRSANNDNFIKMKLHLRNTSPEQ